MKKEFEWEPGETRIKHYSGREGTYLYHDTTIVGGYKIHNLMVEFDDRPGYEVDISGDSMKVLIDGKWIELSDIILGKDY